jgi:periplasmic divalent cation tolerance protein
MAQRRETEILSVTTTVASLDEARRLAAELVERRLAACVQIDPGLESHYRWEGRLCAEAEVRLTVKTTAARLAELQSYVAENHPYELPQLLWTPMSASAAYAEWVLAEVGDPASER